MNNGFDEFMDAKMTPGSASFIKRCEGITQFYPDQFTVENVSNYIKSTNPCSINQISQLKYYLKMYGKFIDSKQLVDTISEISQTDLWKECKKEVKFFSYEQFEELYHDIGTSYELNEFYKQTLFRCIYEGIYVSEDMSALINLRASEINHNVLKIKTDDGVEYDLEVSLKLAEDLKDLSTITAWEANNRFGLYTNPMEGKYPDSCFKFQRYSDNKVSMIGFLRGILRNIQKDYIGSKLVRVHQIFVSGLMHRIAIKLKEADIPLDVAFSYTCDDKLATKIILDELRRCNCDINLRQLKENVDGYLHVFEISDP